MIPFLNAYEASVKYTVRETNGDQELYDIVVECPEISGEVRIYSDLERDLTPYEKGEKVIIVQAPENWEQSYLIADLPEEKQTAENSIRRKAKLMMMAREALPENLPPEVRQAYATTIYLDDRDERRSPISDSYFSTGNQHDQEEGFQENEEIPDE